MENTQNTPLKALVEVDHPWLAMAPLMIGAFVGMLSETSLNIALPQLMTAFNIPAGTVQWLVTGYMLIIGIILPLSSIMTKWFSTRKLVSFGLAAFLIGAVISAIAPSFTILLTGRMIQGLGTGIVLPLMFTIAMQVFAPDKLGGAMGACAMVIMLAPAIGPTITGLILAKLSWNWIFWLFVPFLVVALFLSLTFLVNTTELTKPHVDTLSIIESAFGFAFLVSAVSLISDFGLGSVLVWVLLLAGIIILAFYVRRQFKLTNPILNLKVFKLSQFRIGALIVMVDFGVILSAMYLLPQYIQSGHMLAVAMAGIMLLPGGIVNAVTSAFAGRLYDNIGARKPAIFGFIIALIGSIMLATLTTSSPVWYIILAHIILMIGCPLAMSPSQTYALNAIQGPQAADGSTIMNTLQQIVGAIATAISTILLSLGQNMASSSNKAAAFTNGTHYGFYFSIALIVIGLLLSLKIKKVND
ncbi:DHA2 family efflux MFS transporter permease subunit [uncultured Lactobacillus sp.]|uniref:DHA2 family efflux MFS transporter permease subunit n=1 Tax=uncultured Lactobacillus sp. TaxID=153152 RepID=UPI00263081ED|nr:DHA2 family efflux MFS transporter permease subunit [uncultured Lactobacillus sp.]